MLASTLRRTSASLGRGPVKGDLAGVGDGYEVENRAEIEDAVRVIEGLYARMPSNAT